MPKYRSVQTSTPQSPPILHPTAYLLHRLAVCAQRCWRPFNCCPSHTSASTTSPACLTRVVMETHSSVRSSRITSTFRGGLHTYGYIASVAVLQLMRLLSVLWQIRPISLHHVCRPKLLTSHSLGTMLQLLTFHHQLTAPCAKVTEFYLYIQGRYQWAHWARAQGRGFFFLRGPQVAVVKIFFFKLIRT